MAGKTYCCKDCGSTDYRLRGSSIGTGSWIWCHQCGNSTLAFRTPVNAF